MHYSTFKFALDLQVVQSQVSIPVKFGDTAVRLIITLTDGGVPFTLTEGFLAVLSGVKSDGNKLFNNCMIDIKNSAIIYDFTEQTATSEGITQCEIILYNPDGKVLGTPRFIMLVDNRLVYEASIASEEEADAIDYLIVRAQETEAMVNEAEAARVAAEEIRESQARDRENMANIFSEDEHARFEAETNRANAEAIRIENEASRVEAETARASAEEDRISLFNTLIKLPTYDPKTGVITFESVDGKVKHNIDLIVNAMLTGVKVEGDNFVFNFRTHDGEESVITVPVDNIKIPFTSADKGKAVSVGANGELVAETDLVKSEDIEAAKDEVKTYANTTSANALKGNVQGAAVAMNDVSPVKHTLDVSVSSKNVIPYPYLANTTTVSGITFTTNNDGSVTLNGTATANASFYFWSYDQGIHNPFFDGCTYTIGSTGGRNDVLLYVNYRDAEEDVHIWSGRTFTWSDKYILRYIYLQTKPEATFENYTIYPQIEIGATSTAYTPYVNVSKVKVYKYGRNLIPFPYKVSGTQTRNGVTFTINADGGIYVKGKATETTYLFITDKLPAINVSGVLYPNNFLDGYFASDCWYNPAIGAMITIHPSDGEVDKIFYPQVAIGTSAKTYEPYIAPTEYPVNADGTVDGVTSLSPSTTLLTDTEGALITAEYNKDINKAFEELYNAIISLGGNL